MGAGPRYNFLANGLTRITGGFYRGRAGTAKIGDAGIRQEDGADGAIGAVCDMLVDLEHKCLRC